MHLIGLRHLARHGRRIESLPQQSFIESLSSTLACHMEYDIGNTTHILRLVRDKFILVLLYVCMHTIIYTLSTHCFLVRYVYCRHTHITNVHAYI